METQPPNLPPPSESAPPKIEPPPDGLPDGKHPPPECSDMPPMRRLGGGVLGVMGGFCSYWAGFMLMYLLERTRTFGGGSLSVAYFIVSLLVASWLVSKPGFWRGFAIGIFLGKGTVLLLIGYCFAHI